MRKRILEILQNADDYVSGEDISAALGISRAAVWKHIKKMKNDGMNIRSVRNRGYKIIRDDDPVTSAAVSEYLTTDTIARNIVYKNAVDSTNEEAKRSCDMPDGTLFIAETQTAGKGRLGRGWVSGKGEGIWMSLLLKPDLPPADASQVTLAAGIAVCRAMGGQARIKWPNDIVIGTRKVCGILTEMSAETDRVNYIVPGIGVNVNTVKFGGELKEKATSLFIEYGRRRSRAPIAAAILNEFEPRYKEFVKNGFAALLSEYKSLCVTLGRGVRVIYHGAEITGTAADIDDCGGLVVDTADGGRITVTSGEVSVRGIYGYI